MVKITRFTIQDTRFMNRKGVDFLRIIVLIRTRERRARSWGAYWTKGEREKRKVRMDDRDSRVMVKIGGID